MDYNRSFADAVCESLFDSNQLALGLLAGTRASIVIAENRDRRLVFGNPLTFCLRKRTRRHALVVTTVIRIDCLRVVARDFVGNRFDGSTLRLLEQYANASALDSDSCHRCRNDTVDTTMDEAAIVYERRNVSKGRLVKLH